jgi:hypothetical protein
MHQGFICEWAAINGFGKIHGSSMQPEREFRFFGNRCSPGLQLELAKPENATIQTSGMSSGVGCIQVTFDVDLDGDAVNVRKV